MKQLLFMLVLWVNLSAYAEVIQVEYKRFYSHTRQLKGTDTDQLQFAFGFKQVNQSELCALNSVHIHTDKKQIAINLIHGDTRFILPSERALKLADALIVVDIEGAANQCDMSVQLETQSHWLKAQYTQAELTQVLNQYRAFFDNMGSFLSFLMPQVQGLILVMDEQTVMPEHGLHQLDDAHQLFISAEQIQQATSLILPQAPLRIVAWLEE